MPPYKPVERNGLFIAIVLDEQIQPGTFEFALPHPVGEELNLRQLGAKFRNAATGASTYDPMPRGSKRALTPRAASGFNSDASTRLLAPHESATRPSSNRRHSSGRRAG